MRQSFETTTKSPAAAEDERVPPPTLEARTAALQRAAEHALKHGVHQQYVPNEGLVIPGLRAQTCI